MDQKGPWPSSGLVGSRPGGYVEGLDLLTTDQAAESRPGDVSSSIGPKAVQEHEMTPATKPTALKQITAALRQTISGLLPSK
ncbi:MAG: hypothetical protein WBO35_00505 [Candidatus Saccharimonadales bacterium]